MLVCMKEANGVNKKRLVFVSIMLCILITTSFLTCFSVTANSDEINNSSGDFQHRLIVNTYAYSFSEGKYVPVRSGMIIVSKKFSIFPDRQVTILCDPVEVFEPVYPGEIYNIFIVKLPYLFGFQGYKIPEQQSSQIITEHSTRIDLNTMFGVMPSS